MVMGQQFDILDALSRLRRGTLSLATEATARAIAAGSRLVGS
jgi:hypothetical protein